MRLTTVIFIASLMQVSAAGFAQKITLSKSKAPLEEVIRILRLQSGFNFITTGELLDQSAEVTINVKGAEFKEVLERIFENQPITYRMYKNTVTLLPRKESSVIERLREAFIPALDLTLKITDEQGNALPGATVKILRTSKVFSTDNSGTIKLTNLEENEAIEIYFLGYETARLKAGPGLRQISMKPEIAKLNEVVINKGYYTTTQKLNTGSAIQITSADLEKQPIANPIQALQGMVPGMYIKSNSGMSGASTTVLIRGRNSINSGLIPLYIIDGVPFNGVPVDQQLGPAVTILGGQANGNTDPLNNINPADIESMTILKDADATAIYGSRGANGVVLITTKRAGKGKPTLNVNFMSGLGEVVKQRQLLSSEAYLALRKQAFANDNLEPTAVTAPDLLVWDQAANKNYQDLLIGNTARLNEATASLAMGADRSSLLFSGTYRDEKSVMYGGKGFKRGGFNLRGSHASSDNRLKMDLGANLSISNNNMPGADFAAAAITIPANYPLYDPAGQLYWIRNFNNPLGTARQALLNQSSNIVLSANIYYQILKSLSFKTNLGYNMVSQKLTATNPGSAQNPLVVTPLSSGIYNSNEGKVYIAEPQLDYKTKLWRGNLTATLGGAWQNSKNEMPYFINANTFASEALLGSYTNAAVFTTIRSLSSDYRYVSGFGLLNYNIADKYIFNATFRRDGSSRFGPGKKYGNFGSVGTAWIFSEESFVKEKLNFLSFGKLRSSYGVIGNDQVDNYGYMDTYTTTTSSYGGNSGFYPTRIANPVFRWESNRKFEIAAELGFLKDRIRLTSSYYRNRSDNMVVRSAPLPAQTGFVSYTENLDALIENSGVEFDLHTVPVKSNSLTWELNFNISASRNKLLNLPAELFSLYGNTYQVGKSISSYAVYKHTGFVDGVAQFEDLNGDGSIRFGLTNDYYVAAPRDPKFFGGLSSGLTYKRLRLDLLFNFARQKGIAQTAFPGLIGSQLSDMLDIPFKPSTLTSSSAYSSYARYIASDAVIVDASFIRLRNLSLSYALPERLLGTVKAKKAQLFLRGQNLFTITNYKGLDPETQGSILPPLKMITAGIQCSF
ncbi:SusC/RagA family TonB-linked outer membrane protein [Pedobacter sp. MC2016-24]|uniref:SusC/RagA family TonB-linked outer membrane protein n=1 Tax=Pedobacter sp. MC2016-24 TaxID=2780090 RepID=UPI0018829E39|nr:SusC/RagA family TonB-linked outer membrane protein [Pedobacter sp. MC2016-24]MBE9601579.1 SusC/RagA family TonB-linked outer membrane protein [Pedobacter sp. MC2016-24]